jgi:NADP-dependent 3-hydroxy acid dehydrogenase YdfG
VIVAARNVEKCEEVAAEIRAAGGEALALAVDMSSRDSIQAAFSQAAKDFGPIGILVDNAGITKDGLALRMKPEDWNIVLQTNLSGAFFAMQAVMQGMMKERWGRMINIVSVVGEMGNAGQANYVALEGRTHRPHQVPRPANSPAAASPLTPSRPGFIETDMTAVLTDEQKAAMQGISPPGPSARPTTSPRRSNSSPETARATSPATSSTSTAACTCAAAGRAGHRRELEDVQRLRPTFPRRSRADVLLPLPRRKSQKKPRKRCAQAAARGAQIICLQELFRSQYFCREEKADLFDLAEPIPGPATAVMGQLAKELDVVIVSSLFEKRAHGLYHNTATVHDAGGEMLGIFRKMHIPDDPLFYEKFYFTPGDLGFKNFDEVRASASSSAGTSGIRKPPASRPCKVPAFSSTPPPSAGTRPRR